MRVAVHRARHLDADDAQQDDQHDRPQDRLVVALAGVAPAALVDPREDEHDQASPQHPPDRPFEQQLVVVRQLRAAASAVLEAQLERQVVRERDQRPIHRELGQGVPVYGKGRRADPSAHWHDCTGCSVAQRAQQQVHQNPRVAAHALGWGR